MALAMMLGWAIAYAGLLIWTLKMRNRVVLSGLVLALLSLFPMSYGRWITPSDWHDYPLMPVYYLPTIVAFLVSLIVVVVGLVAKTRKAFSRRGA